MIPCLGLHVVSSRVMRNIAAKFVISSKGLGPPMTSQVFLCYGLLGRLFREVL